MKAKVKKLSVVALSALALAACSNSSEGEKQFYSVTDQQSTLSVTNGGTALSYKGKTVAEKQEIMGLLEKYAVENNLTGISLFEDGGYVMYSDTVKLGASSYVPGYGFGVLREGNITADLAGETNAAWKRYYHDFQAEDPGNLNYMDDKGSVVGGIIGYSNAQYFTNKLNEQGTGYEWVGELSKQDRPTLLNDDGTVAEDQSGVGTKFRFEVRTGKDGFVYNTKGKYSQYAGHEVTIDDYVTPYKLKWTQAIGYARGAEQLTGSGSIKGSSDYYNASASAMDENFFDSNVGVKGYEKDGKSYLEFELNQATTPFMAMYYLSSPMYAPVPMDFIKELGNGDVMAGAKNWGKKTNDKLTPVDTTLSTGPYVISSWQTDQLLVWDKNEKTADYYNAQNAYKIPGIHMAILKAQATDSEAAFKEFLANKLSAVSIPTTRLNEYKSDSRSHKTTGTSVFKLNVNTCDSKMWEELFGTNGTVAQQPTDKWQVEAAMSNKDFIKGLSYSINRTEFAEKRGRVPSVNFFSSNYLIDPENGISWNSTKEHQAAVAGLTNNGQNADGFSKATAQAYFKKAADQLIAEGKYKKGDKITIEIAWMYQFQVTTYGDDIKKYFEETFNTTPDIGLTLEVTNMAVAAWDDVYYEKMMVGKFDLGFGSISGNTYDPLNFLEVLKSDNSSGFTLNWGTDTNDTSKSYIEYDGKKLSFDALWQATDSSVYVNAQGNAIKTSDFYDAGIISSVHNEDGTRTVILNTLTFSDDTNSTTINDFLVIATINGVDVTINSDFVTISQDDPENKPNQFTIIIPEGIESIADYIYIDMQVTVNGQDCVQRIYIQVAQ